MSTYLLAFAPYYPEIEAWAWKLRDGVPTRRRSVFAFISGHGSIDGLAITKNEENAKLCHISVAHSAREDGLGASLMRVAVQEMLLAGARRIHVTTGEEVATDYGQFFERFRFRHHAVWKNRYRHGFDELEWAASRETVASRVWNEARVCAVQERTRASLMRLHRVGEAHDFEWKPVLHHSTTPCAARIG
jgi:GNAT superfamily N-acetyltransferase